MNYELGDRSGELNQANTFLGAVLRSLEAGVVVVNGDLLVQTWNEGARELWGLHESEVVGRHLLNLDIGLPLGELRKPILEALGEGGGTRTATVLPVNRRGREIECHVTVTPLADDGGRSKSAILMMQALDGGV